MTRPAAHKWTFAPRFRRHAFGWRSQPAAQRVREAGAEIQKVARKDPALAAAGAVLFLEKVSPALEQVDSSSGAIGTAVNHAIEICATIIAGYGYEITGVDVLAACSSTLAAARNGGWTDEIEGRIRALVAGPRSSAKDLFAASLGTRTIS